MFIGGNHGTVEGDSIAKEVMRAEGNGFRSNSQGSLKPERSVGDEQDDGSSGGICVGPRSQCALCAS